MIAVAAYLGVICKCVAYIYALSCEAPPLFRYPPRGGVDARRSLLAACVPALLQVIASVTDLLLLTVAYMALRQIAKCPPTVE